MGGFTVSLSPSPPASEDESDDGFGSDDADEDDDTSSSDDDEMTTLGTCPLSFVTKRGSSFVYESSHVFRGRVSIGDIFVRGSVFFFFRDVMRNFCIFSFLFLFRYIVLTL